MKTKLLLMLLVVGLAAGVASANLLKNPSFEEGAFESNDTPDYWTHYWTDWAPTHVWISDADGAHSGSKYMQIKMWTTGSSGWRGSGGNALRWEGGWVPVRSRSYPALPYLRFRRRDSWLLLPTLEPRRGPTYYSILRESGGQTRH